jgi:acyl-CoA thioesterase-1
MRCRTLLLIALLVAGCGDERGAPAALPGEAPSQAAGIEAVPAAPAIPADAPLVAVLGDSLAAGLHLAAEQAFPAVLQRNLAAVGLPFRLVNAGVSGDTSAGGLRRIDWILQQKPAVLVVELGGNDGLRGQDVAGVEANLRAIVQRAQAAGARVVLLGVQVPTSLGAEYGARFAAVYPRIASELGVAFVPGFLDGVGGVPEMLLEDGLHPTPAGHRRLAQNIAPTLRSALEELRAAGRR